MSKKFTTTAMAKAIEVIQTSSLPQICNRPEDDNQLLIYRHILSHAAAVVKDAVNVEYMAAQARKNAQKNLAEIKVRVELREQELGISRAVEVTCEHTDIDKHRCCIDCGEDLTEAACFAEACGERG